MGVGQVLWAGLTGVAGSLAMLFFGRKKRLTDYASCAG
jgi:hypothetical protein